MAKIIFKSSGKELKGYYIELIHKVWYDPKDEDIEIFVDGYYKGCATMSDVEIIEGNPHDETINVYIGNMELRFTYNGPDYAGHSDLQEAYQSLIDDRYYVFDNLDFWTSTLPRPFGGYDIKDMVNELDTNCETTTVTMIED
jgi:hypothetical protein